MESFIRDDNIFEIVGGDGGDACENEGGWKVAPALLIWVMIVELAVSVT